MNATADALSDHLGDDEPRQTRSQATDGRMKLPINAVACIDLGCADDRGPRGHAPRRHPLAVLVSAHGPDKGDDARRIARRRESPHIT